MSIPVRIAYPRCIVRTFSPPQLPAARRIVTSLDLYPLMRQQGRPALGSVNQYIDPRNTLISTPACKPGYTNDCLNKLCLRRQIKQLPRPQGKRQSFIILA